MKFIFVFAAMFALDYVWANYTKAVAANNAAISANWAAIIIMLSGIVTTNYVADPWMLIPAALGAWCGTYCAAKRVP